MRLAAQWTHNLKATPTITHVAHELLYIGARKLLIAQYYTAFLHNMSHKRENTA